MKINKVYFLVIFPLILLFLVITSNVSAFSVFDVLKDVKDAILGKEDKNIKDKKFTIESDITLAQDENNNGEIDGGDTVRFIYTLTNTTNDEYGYAALKTNIDKNNLHLFYNLSGVTGLTYENDIIILKYIRIGVKEQRVLSFDAKVNYFDEDQFISTEPEFLTEDKKSISKSQKIETKINRLTDEEKKKFIGQKDAEVLDKAKEDKKEKISIPTEEPSEAESTSEGDITDE